MLALMCSVLPSVVQAGLEDRVQEHTLENGMKILMMERHQSPTVSMYMKFKAGSVDEWTGIGGTAHLLEHMLFKGTTSLGTTDWEKERPILEEIEKVGAALDVERLRGSTGDAMKINELSARLKKLQEEHKKHIIKDEIDEIYSKAGAVGFNAFTSRDFTTYVISLPSNRFELWCRIESDRMADPVLREYYSERDVVMEERRRSYDSRPSGTLYEQFIATAFTAHPYRAPTIGWMSELRFLSLENTKKFRKIYYAPNNTIVAVVGDIDPEKVIAMMTRYFGGIPSQELHRGLSTAEPPQKGEKRIKIEYDANPMVSIGFHKPTLPSRADYVLDIASALLTHGRTSRLYKSLVQEKQIAISVDTTNGSPGGRFDSLFVIDAAPRHPHTVAELEVAIYAELDTMATELVEERELQKVINQTEANMIRGMNSNSGLASSLSYFEALAGDWRYLVKYLDVIKTIKREEIRDTVAKYFVPKNRTVAELVKTSVEPQKSDGKGD